MFWIIYQYKILIVNVLFFVFSIGPSKMPSTNRRLVQLKLDAHQKWIGLLSSQLKTTTE